MNTVQEIEAAINHMPRDDELEQQLWQMPQRVVGSICGEGDCEKPKDPLDDRGFVLVLPEIKS